MSSVVAVDLALSRFAIRLRNWLFLLCTNFTSTSLLWLTTSSLLCAYPCLGRLPPPDAHTRQAFNLAISLLPATTKFLPIHVTHVTHVTTISVGTRAYIDPDYYISGRTKWGHLKDLHKAIKLCEEALATTDPNIASLGPNIEVEHGHIKAKKSHLEGEFSQCFVNETLRVASIIGGILKWILCNTYIPPSSVFDVPARKYEEYT
ncbi:Glycoside hydrolase [Vigna unguiculata]|uniref:Glycoside hydrolase n=1 Tax=Vigna unguiculata TaxID=3917 RepID=A0A4D6KNZ3_VIGUN|nr:Glycoside hydrolase [Vigna unguiculata]